MTMTVEDLLYSLVQDKSLRFNVRNQFFEVLSSDKSVVTQLNERLLPKDSKILKFLELNTSYVLRCYNNQPEGVKPRYVACVDNGDFFSYFTLEDYRQTDKDLENHYFRPCILSLQQMQRGADFFKYLLHQLLQGDDKRYVKFDSAFETLVLKERDDLTITAYPKNKFPLNSPILELLFEYPLACLTHNNIRQLFTVETSTFDSGNLIHPGLSFDEALCDRALEFWNTWHSALVSSIKSA